MRDVKHKLVRVVQWTLYVCGFMFIGIVGIRVYDEVRYTHLRTPDNVRDIGDFRRWNPALTNAQAVTVRGSTFYAITGPFARFKASGPSEYYFDQNGNYVGRNVDTGDFYEPAIFFAKEAQRKPINIEQIPNPPP